MVTNLHELLLHEGGEEVRVEVRSWQHVEDDRNLQFNPFLLGNSPVGLRDADSGSEQFLNLDAGAELSRIITAEGLARTAGALFDALVASARVVPPAKGGSVERMAQASDVVRLMDVLL